MSGAGRGQRQIEQFRPAGEMPVVEPSGAAAVERDGADAGVRVEEIMDPVRHLGGDCRIGASEAMSRLTDIP